VAAEYLRADAAAVPISANDAVERRLRENNIMLEKTKIGSPYVIAALDKACATGMAKRIVGWEANGGFLTASDIPLRGGRLEALPTRDATLPILASLFAAAEQGISLTALWNHLPPRFGSAGLLDNFPMEASQAILAQLIPTGVVIEAEFGDKALRGCSNAGLLGASVSKSWHKCMATLKRFFTPALGFDDIARINGLDGVRIYFRNGDVAHIRPSGNAPQLRVYANSDTPTRADRIVELALREPDGILRQLQRALA
jgi:phosphomannomutase